MYFLDTISMFQFTTSLGISFWIAWDAIAKTWSVESSILPWARRYLTQSGMQSKHWGSRMTKSANLRVVGPGFLAPEVQDDIVDADTPNAIMISLFALWPLRPYRFDMALRRLLISCWSSVIITLQGKFRMRFLRWRLPARVPSWYPNFPRSFWSCRKVANREFRRS